MEFDQNNLIPLYKLRAGEPGQSHAIEIARQFGLPEKVIAHARELLGSGNVAFDNLIADLNKKRSRYEKELDDIEKRKHELGGLKKQWEDRVDEIENEKKKVLADACEDAADIMAQTKREMHAMLEEMKKKSRPEGKTVIKELEKRQKEMSEKIQELRPAEADTPDIDDIKAGDTVFVAALGYDVTIAEVDRKRSRLRVRAGSLEIEVPLSEVSPGKGIVLETGTDEMSDVKPEGVVLSKINLVGLRADDALSRLEPFLNHAVLGGLRELVIIHGIGEGILLKVIRNYLKDHPLVKEFRNGEQSEGGGGVTIVTLK
jgi:DNA mismatch repair protein MutS2